MQLLRITLPAVIAAALVACASAPQNIAPNTVSAELYRALSCSQLAQELLRATDMRDEAIAAQRRERVWDGVLSAIVFSGIGGITPGHADEVADGKGKVETIQREYDTPCLQR